MDNNMMTAEMRQARMQRIEDLLAQNLSRAQIAERLGLTRDQVQGLIHKERQRQQRAAARAARGEPPITPRVTTNTVKVERATPSLPRATNLPVIATDLSFEPPEGKLNIWNVKRNHCRYLDAEGYFCGEPAVRASYCQHHYNRCYTPTQRKVRPWPNSQRSPFENFA